MLTCSVDVTSVSAYPDGPASIYDSDVYGQVVQIIQTWDFDVLLVGGGTQRGSQLYNGGVGRIDCPAQFEYYWDPIPRAGCRRTLSTLGPKNSGPCCDRPSGGGPLLNNPINASVGNKVQVESDYVGTGPFPLTFKRTYNSMYNPSFSRVGSYWTTNFDKRIISTGSTSQFLVTRGDGRTYLFSMNGNVGVPDADISDQLVRNVDVNGATIGWEYHTQGDDVESYDSAGLLQSIQNRDGLTQLLTYSDASTPHEIAPKPGLLIGVTDPQGRSIQFTYDSVMRISTMTEPLGGVTRYAYTFGTNAVLTSQTDPANRIRTYLYNEPAYTNNANLPFALTGIIDENTKRFATFGYDATGKATLTEHAGGVDSLVLQYDAVTATTTTTDALGAVRVYTTTSQYGVKKPVSMTKPCATCPDGVATSSQTYDANGYPDLTTDFNGMVTDHDYDSRGLEYQRIEAKTVAGGATPAEKRTLVTNWNASFRVPDQRSVKNLSGTVESLTKWNYAGNTRGQATARCEIDPSVSGATSYICGSSTNAPSGVRQWQTVYCEKPDVSAGTCPLIGLVKSVNGPRLATDPGMGGVDDITSYTYYQTDDASCASGGACPHRHGDLWKVTNALGQVTTYVTYDKNGRAARVQDANGTLTDFVYHVRGWLTDRIARANTLGTPSPSDATLHIDYDPVGNVTKMTQPDGAYLSYTYDDAHRLLKISDNLDNTIDYCPDGVGTADCLDAAGNRWVEEVTDSSDVKRSLHRVYNQLGQLTQVLNAAGLPVETSTDLSETGVVDGYDGNGNRILRDDGLGFRTDKPTTRLTA